MLDKINIEKVLFLDVETVPAYADYNTLPALFKTLWEKKALHIKKNDDETPELLYEKAGIYAEFGKIICISVGFLKNSGIRIKSFYNDQEEILLKDFADLLDTYYNTPDFFLCAHNGKEFDYPYIARRMLINGIRIPGILNLAGKKPWEVAHLDTMELWKFGDFKNYTSLELLAAVFQIPTPKDDIKGSDVARVYWKEKDLQRIVAYCQKDVITIIQLLRKFMGMEMIPSQNIRFPD